MNSDPPYIPLISPCPGKDCVNIKRVYKWKHPRCGTPLTITSKANVYCSHCNITTKYQDIPFRCKEHKDKEFPSKDGTHYAFSKMISISKDPLTKSFLSSLLMFLDSQFELSSTEIPFISRCPISSCENISEVFTWYHPDKSCKGLLNLTIEGDIHCTKCEIRIPFMEWPFQCPNHYSNRFVNQNGIINVVSSLKEESKLESELFFDTLLDNLLKKYSQLSEDEFEEIEFIAPCPCDECKNLDNVFNWKHPQCGGDLHLTRRGEIKCIRCEKKMLFSKWMFDCGKHQEQNATIEGMQKCFRMITLNATFTKKQLFIAKVTSEVMKQFIDEEKIRKEDNDKEDEEGEIEFEAPCPVDKCKRKLKIYNWKHTECGGMLVLTDDGYIKCKECGKKKMFIEWPFECEDHGEELPSIQGTCNSLSILSRNNQNDEYKVNLLLQITSTIMAQFINNKQ